MPAVEYSHFGGTHPETAALRNLLASQSILTADSGAECTEALLFGIGGGVGSGYWVFEFAGLPPAIALGARHNWQSSPGTFCVTTATRLGLRVEVNETSGHKRSDSALRATLDEGTPAILAVDRASIPHWLMPPEMIKYHYHLLVAVGSDPDTDVVYVDDLAPHPLPVHFSQLSRARGAITSMKRRMLTVAPGDELVDLTAAIDAGIADCVRGLLNPPIRNFGLASIEKWASLITNRKDKKGWPTVFPPGPRLYHGLASVARLIEASDTGGGLMRGMYARFLDQAHQMTGRPELRESAERYRALVGMWSDLAATALPKNVPALGETRQLDIQRDALFREQGARAAGEMRSIDERLAAIAGEMSENFPLSNAAASDLLAAMRDSLLAIHAAEVAAATSLRAHSPPS